MNEYFQYSIEHEDEYKVDMWITPNHEEMLHMVEVTTKEEDKVVNVVQRTEM